MPLATIAPTFAGELIGPDHPDYDQARRLCNGMIDKRPAMIARCTSPMDVQIALAHAREQGLIVAVRGGGHSTPGHSSCDDGIVIDTGPMKGVEIDVERRTGRFGAGLTWGELDAATQQHDLAVTGGMGRAVGQAGRTDAIRGRDELRAWARAFMQTMRRWSVDKAPANFIESDEGPARLRRSYGDETFARLEALKDKYDPDNVFSLNPNILPTTARVTGAR